MRLVCINQFIDAISAMLLSGYLGNWLDRHDRRFGKLIRAFPNSSGQSRPCSKLFNIQIPGTLTVLAVNNISVAVSALMLFLCLSAGSHSSLLYTVCIGMSIIFCALSKCASEAEKLSFTKDWIVVLAKKEGDDTLSSKFFGS
jgi:hypothetical protein